MIFARAFTRTLSETEIQLLLMRKLKMYTPKVHLARSCCKYGNRQSVCFRYLCAYAAKPNCVGPRFFRHPMAARDNIYIYIYTYMIYFKKISGHPFSQAYQRTELCAQILRSQSCRTLLVISVFTVGSSFVAFALKYIGIQRGTTSSLPTEGVEFSWLPVCMSTKPSSWA